MRPWNHKPLIIFALAIVSAMLLGLGMARADMEELTLNQAPEGTVFQRSEVWFPHEAHMGNYECLDCHHQYEEGSKENVLDEDELEEGNEDILCSACHNADAKIDRRTAFHRMCITCHINARKQANSSGPEMCGSCHPR